MQSIEASYDQIPYTVLACQESRIDRLEGIARIRGMEPANAQVARVLELGCARGGNLLPLAYRFPSASFLGIDLSGQQILDAKKYCAELALENVSFRHQDLCTLGAEEGSFDYILAHGLFSWVPEPVRLRLLEIIRLLLAPNGVAFVSYNVLPGWHHKAWAREVMAFAGGGLDGLARLEAARTLLREMAGSPHLPEVARQMLAANQKELAEKDPSYLMHDYLAEFNLPLRFIDFHKMIQSSGLDYVADASNNFLIQSQMPTMAAFNEDSDPVAGEQLSDILRNRSFRMSLLCRADCRRTRRPPGEILDSLRLRSFLLERPGLKAPQGFSTFETMDEQARIVVPDGPIQQTLKHLQSVFPGSAAFSELQGGIDPEAFGKEILDLWKLGHLDLLPRAECFPEVALERPLASPIARWGAALGENMTRLDHGRVSIPDPIRHLLGLMDGKRSLQEITREGVQRGFIKPTTSLQEITQFVHWCRQRMLLAG